MALLLPGQPVGGSRPAGTRAASPGFQSWVHGRSWWTEGLWPGRLSAGPPGWRRSQRHGGPALPTQDVALG